MMEHALSREIIDSVNRKLWDIPYAQDSPSQVLDIWYPGDFDAASLPTIVHFHGGGFSEGGHREDSLEPMLRALGRGYIVVSVEYRKSGETLFPGMVCDAHAAIRFLKAHASEYGIDSSRIALWGPSAGGWLVSMAALTVGNPAFDAMEMGNADVDSTVAAVIDWCGPCGGFLNMDPAFQRSGKGEPNHNHADSGESKFMGCALPNAPVLVRMADPRIYVNLQMPPFLIMHGEDDAVVPVEQSIAFAQAIRNEVGSERVKLLTFRNVPHHGRIWWHEPEAANVVLDFLDDVFRN